MPTIDLNQCKPTNGPQRLVIQPPKALLEDSSKRLARAKELHADASAARRRGKEHQQHADDAKAIMQQLRDDSMRLMRNETVLQMAERHVAEAERQSSTRAS